MASLETARRKSPTDVTSSLSCSHCPVLIDWLLRSAGPKPPLEHSYQPPTTSVICKSSACGAARLRAVGYDSKSSVAKLIATSYQLPATSYQLPVPALGMPAGLFPHIGQLRPAMPLHVR